MAIEKKLIHFGKLADFEAQLTAGNILDRSIVFIQDAKKIWTHGTYYDCTEGGGASGSVQSDWSVNDETSAAYVKNRTHYGHFSELDVTGISISSEKSIYIPNSIGQIIYVKYDFGSQSKTLKLDADDTTTIHTLNYGPQFKVARGVDGVRVLGNEDSGHHLYAATDVTELADFYIPDTVARTDGFKTVNGESIVGNGNVELPLGDDNVQADWSVYDSTSDAYIKNRTHSVMLQGALTDVSVSSSQIGTNIFEVYTDVAFVIDGLPYNTLDAVGAELTIPNKNQNKFTVVEDNGSYFVRFTQISGGGISFSYCNRASVTTLPDAFISDSIARKSDIATINGQPLVNGGDITISGESDNDVYVFVVEDEYGTITEEEYNAIKNAKIVNINMGPGFDIVSVSKVDWSEAGLGISLIGIIIIDSSRTSIIVNIQNDLTYSVNYGEEIIPTTTSQLENDSNFVSSDNLKTINGQSIVGSGDITISGGSSSGGSGAYAEVNHGTSDTTFTLAPNTFHVWDEVASLTLTLGDETAGVANEFLFQFTSGSTATSLTLPDDIKWANDSAPTISENKIYQISVLKGLANCLEFNNPLLVEMISFSVDGTPYQAPKDMTWQDFCDSEYNTYGFYISFPNIITPQHSMLYSNGGLYYVYSQEVIQATDYTIHYNQGGGM